MVVEATNTATYILNRSPHKKIIGKTPEEMWTGNKVDLSHLRIFGCTAYARIPEEKRQKLDSTSKRHIFVGYSEESKAYRLIDPENPTKIIRARDVIFLENEIVSHVEKCSTESAIKLSELLQDCSRYTNDQEVDDVNIANEGNASLSENCNEETEVEQEICHQPPEVEEEVCHQQNEEDRRYPLRDRKPKQFPNHVTYVAETFQTMEPNTYDEAMSSTESKNWKKAIDEEIHSFEENQAWILVDKPSNHPIVKSKWVFKTKKDSDGNISCYRARLVAKGYSQHFGIDYNETFAPVVRYSSLRLLFAIGVRLDLEIDHLDVCTAFLNGQLKEKIYMELPEGMHIEDKEKNKVYLLKKAIYGLKQAARSWNQKATNILKNLGYNQCTSEPCIFFKHNNTQVVYVALFVDDFFLFYNDKSEVENLKKTFQKHFKIKDLGSVKNCIGMEVERDRNKKTIKLTQKQYLNNVLQKYGMINSKPVSSPIEFNTKLEHNATNKECKADIPYQSAIGSLLYLAVCSRPDISFAVTYLSQFNNSYGTEHWTAVKRIMRYLNGTKDKGLLYTNDESDIIGYSDAD